MYIFKNALRCIARAKGRNILIGAVVLLLSVSSCIGLSIRQSNRTLKKQYADDMEISATLNTKGGVKQGNTAPDLATLQELAANESVKSFSYTASLYLAAGDDIEPLDVAGSFQQNKDFKQEHGDVQNGDQTTTSSTETIENTAAKVGAVADVLLLANESGVDSADSQSDSGREETKSETDKDKDRSDSTSQADDDHSESRSGKEDESQAGQSDKDKTDTESKPTEGETEKEDAAPGAASGDDAMPDMPQMPTDDAADATEMPTPPSGDSGTAPADAGDGSVPQMSGGNTQFNTFVTNQFFFNMASMNDFTLTAYSDLSVLPEYIAELGVLSADGTEFSAVISQNLADENEFAVGSTFTLKNPDNEDEVYTFTVAGIYDSSQTSDESDTASNASFTDNLIYTNFNVINQMTADSAALNPATESTETTDEDSDSATDENAALTATYAGTFVFANLTDYNTFSEAVSADYTVVSEDVQNYEQSITQLETLGQYATYFLIVIFLIGAFVLVIINLFSIRDRKYEIGVLTAIGMKKIKVASQFVTELFIITFAALIIGSAVGAAVSVPVTNSLLTTINSSEAETTSTAESADDAAATDGTESPDKPDGQGGGMDAMKQGMQAFGTATNHYIANVTSATDLTVILQMIPVGLGLTLISALAAVAFVMRYEPLKILSNRD